MPDEFLTRGVNDEFSGGEQKRMETLQLAVLAARRSRCSTSSTRASTSTRCASSPAASCRSPSDSDLGVLAITHYARLLTELRPDRVHVLMAGRVVTTGGPDLADRLEEIGYEGLAAELGVEDLAGAAPRARRPLRRPGLLTRRQRAGTATVTVSIAAPRSARDRSGSPCVDDVHTKSV